MQAYISENTPTVIIKNDGTINYLEKGESVNINADDIVIPNLEFFPLKNFKSAGVAIEKIDKIGNAKFIVYRDLKNNDIKYYLSLLYKDNDDKVHFEIVKMKNAYNCISHILDNVEKNLIDLNYIKENLDYDSEEYITREYENFILKYPKIRGIKQIIQKAFPDQRPEVVDDELSFYIHNITPLNSEKDYKLYTLLKNPYYTIVCFDEKKRIGIQDYFEETIKYGKIKNYFDIVYVYPKAMDRTYIIDKAKNTLCFWGFGFHARYHKPSISIRCLEVNEETINEIIKAI